MGYQNDNLSVSGDSGEGGGCFAEENMKYLKAPLYFCIAISALAFLFRPAAGEAMELPDAIKQCVKCHKNYVNTWLPTKHAKVWLGNPQNEMQERACETCHGDGARHIADAKAKADSGGSVDLGLIRVLSKKSTLSAEEKNSVCLQCHSGDGTRALWAGSSHEANGITCVDCHQHKAPVMAVKRIGHYARQLPERIDLGTELCGKCHTEKRAMLMRSSHMPLREGKMTCADCHNPHGGKGPANLIQGSVNENCYSCHAEKRGPMLWEHPPVRDNCSNCHSPHGSNYANLLKSKGPYLCQQCHMASYHPSALYEGSGIPANGGAAKQQLARHCLSCHTQVHGSNHPSGPRLTR